MTSPNVRLPHFTLTGPLGISLFSLGLAILFVLGSAFSVLATALGRGAGTVQPAQELVKLVDEHKVQMQNWQTRFNGRSIFFKPPPKPQEYKPPPPPPVTTVTAPPPPPPPPTKYTGPSIIWAMAPDVTFKSLRANEKPFTVREGEEMNGVKVISVKGPWTVRLGYGGGEFDVPIFATTEEPSFLVFTPRPNVLLPGIIEVDDQGKPTTSGSPNGRSTTITGSAAAKPPVVEDGDDEGDNSTAKNGEDPDDEKDADEPPARAHSTAQTPSQSPSRRQRFRNQNRNQPSERPAEVRKAGEPEKPSSPDPSPPSL